MTSSRDPRTVAAANGIAADQVPCRGRRPQTMKPAVEEESEEMNDSEG